MIVQTVTLACQADAADQVQAALQDVVDHARSHEPDTPDYRVLRCAEGETVVFTTIECFTDMAAMELHNASDAVGKFFEAAGALLSAPPEVRVSHQVIKM